MKILTELAFILFLISINLKNIDTLKFCCCIYRKDPFRGFEKSFGEVMETDIPESSEKEEIGNKFLKLCLSKNGLPSFENIDRVNKGKYDVTPQTCDKECSYLILEMNDKFDLEQEENRMEHARKLREKRKSLNDLLKNKMSNNLNDLYKGKQCIYELNKYKKDKNKKNSNNCIDHNLQGDKNKKINNNTNVEFEGDLSFLTLSDENLDYLEIGNNNHLGEDLFENFDANKHHSDTLSLVTTENNIAESDLSEEAIKTEIINLDNQILHLETKNKRPFSFILERLSIPDDILIMMLKIFETTLDDAVIAIKQYYEDTIYFQFRIVDKIRPHNKKKFL
jgi:hypothetical protein